jgi:hypothetical protein
MSEQKYIPATPGWQADLFNFDDWLSRNEFVPGHRGRTLRAGDRVEFDVSDGVDGPSYATNVRLIEPD